MKYAAYRITGFSSAPAVIRLSKRRGLMAALLAALHHSRRREAERVLRRHQHLIAQIERRQAGELKSEFESGGHVDK
jgi:hypothetical protein